MKVVLVGLNPSNKNSDPNIPFVGTKSLDVLDSWTDQIFTPEDELIYANAVTDVVTSDSSKIKFEDVKRNLDALLIRCDKLNPDILIILGNKTYEFLAKANFFTRIYAYSHGQQPIMLRWPHPSPRNRFLNSKKKVDEFLTKQRQTVFMLHVQQNLRDYK